jgi:hypothetical protein
MAAQKFIEPVLVEPPQKNYLETQLHILYIKIFTSRTKKIFPDWFVIQIEGNFSRSGMSQPLLRQTRPSILT